MKIAEDNAPYRFRVTPGSMLTQEGGQLYQNFKETNAMPDATELRNLIDQEQRFLDRCLSDAPVRGWRAAVVRPGAGLAAPPGAAGGVAGSAPPGAALALGQ